jgi:thymidine kinase
MIGRIEVICGSMFSGKTEELIRRLKRLKYANQSFKVFKPEIDTRNKKNIIKSHGKIEIEAKTVSNAKEILDLSTDIDVIGIDEAQFFSEDLVNVCNTLANRGTRVIVAGLDMDFSGKPFGPMPNLMAIAEEVTKVHAVCSETGEPALYSYRKGKNNNVVLLGEKDEYEPLSRKAFISKMKNK